MLISPSSRSHRTRQTACSPGRYGVMAECRCTSRGRCRGSSRSAVRSTRAVTAWSPSCRIMGSAPTTIRWEASEATSDSRDQRAPPSHRVCQIRLLSSCAQLQATQHSRFGAVTRGHSRPTILATTGSAASPSPRGNLNLVATRFSRSGCHPSLSLPLAPSSLASVSL